MRLDQHEVFLLSRTDHIGDVVLTLPMVKVLKQARPHCRVILLVRQSTQAVVQSCLDVDDVIGWESLSSLSVIQQVKILQSFHVTTLIHVFPNIKVAWLGFLARIPRCIGTSRRWYHLFTCCQRVRMSRAASLLHEAQLNLKLLSPLGLKSHYSLQELKQVITLKPKMNVKVDKWCEQWLDNDRFKLIVHPFSNKSAREWPILSFISLINKLSSKHVQVVLTGSVSESKLIKDQMLPHCPHVLDTSGQWTLSELLSLIGRVDGLLAASTGPLHLAAASGCFALGLFPPKKHINPERWGPLGPKASAMVEAHPCTQSCDDGSCLCMQALTVDRVYKEIMTWVE